MTTKDQERKVLEQIRKLVAELGEDSYIATAFEGCFEIAEENIKNDFACSMKQRAESAAKEREEWHQKATSFEIKWNEDEQNIADLYDELRSLQEKCEKDCQFETHKTAEWKKAADERQETINDFIVKTADLQKQLDEKDLEIMKLKARLFDMMNA